MCELRAVFWDVDGTLADSEMEGHRPAYNVAFVKEGLSWHWDKNTYARLLFIAGGYHRLQSFAREQGTELDSEQLYRVRLAKQEHYLRRVKNGDVPLRQGVRRLVHELKASGIQQWIVTSSSRSSVKALLDANFPDPDTFCGCITSEDVGRPKPSPEGYALALTRSCCAANEVIVIEDSHAGLLAACAAGLACLVTPSVWDHRITHEHCQACAVLSSLGEPNYPASLLRGLTCPESLVTVDYLQLLLLEFSGR